MLFRSLLALLVLCAGAVPAVAQVSPTYTFSTGTVISSTEVNANFALLSSALNRTGGTITGNITVDAGVTIDGVDLSAWLNQALLTTSSPTFVGLTTTGALAVGGSASMVGTLTVSTGSTTTTALDVNGGIQAGSGNVNIVDIFGRIPAISSTYFSSLDGTNLTGVAKLGSANTFTAINKLKTYSETRTAIGNSGTAFTIDLSAGTAFTVTANGNPTVTISNPVTSGEHGSFMLLIAQDGSARTFTWPGTVRWQAGVAYAATGTSGKIDVVTCVYNDGGSNYLCSFNANY